MYYRVWALALLLMMLVLGTPFQVISVKIPINELKPDRSFDSEIDDDETNPALSFVALQIGMSIELECQCVG